MKRMNEYEVILNGFYNGEDKPNFFVRIMWAENKNKAQNEAIKALECDGIVDCSIVTTLIK